MEMLLSAEGVCLKLDNQKNGWKGVCVYHQHNGDPLRCPIRALAWRVTHMHSNNTGPWEYLSSYYVNGARKNVKAEDISKHLKLAAGLLNYPTHKGISVERIDIHSLRGGGANALALSGYSETTKKWDDGMGPRSKSTFGKSWQTMSMVCPRRRKQSSIS